MADADAPLTIQPSNAEVGRGDLNVRIVGNALLLPRGLAQNLAQQGVRTASDLLSYLQAYPSDVAARLNWSAADVAGATAKLRAVLAGHVDSSILGPQPDAPPLGARDPNERSGGDR